MEYTAREENGEGCLIDIGSLYQRLEKLKDKRSARGKRYSVAQVIVLAVLAKLAGESTPYGIAQWAQLRQADLIEGLGIRRESLPSHNTYRRVLGEAVDALELEQIISEFLMVKPQEGQRVLLALDGKTLRGTIPKGQTQGVHLLAAYLPEEGIVLTQIAVKDRQNEISAAPQVLKCLDLREKVIVADAMHTQRKLSAQIVAAGGDYVWIVKDNQPTLLEDIERLFRPEEKRPGFGTMPEDFVIAQTVSRKRGRLEKRTLTASSLLADQLDWPHLAQVFKLERHTTFLNSDRQRAQTVYGITSLSSSEADPARLLQFVRGYWAIENGLHYRRDKTLNEDAVRMSNPSLAHVTAILNNLVVALALKHGFANLAFARRFFSAHVSHALSLLLRTPT